MDCPFCGEGARVEISESDYGCSCHCQDCGLDYNFSDVPDDDEMKIL
jgi:transcription elongation factor Elf1